MHLQLARDDLHQATWGEIHLYGMGPHMWNFFEAQKLLKGQGRERLLTHSVLAMSSGVCK